MADKAGKAASTTKASQDDIAGLLRYRDQIRKEVRMLQLYRTREGGTSEFKLNPATLKPLTQKIGYAPDRRVSPEETAAFQRDVEALSHTLATARRLPSERGDFPETASQDLGWYAQRFYSSIAKPYRVATHKTSEEVAFGKVYASTMGAGPFDKTQPLAR